jgi:hypothetical protein
MKNASTFCWINLRGYLSVQMDDDNIEILLNKLRCEDIDWNKVTQNTFQKQSVVKR